MKRDRLLGLLGRRGAARCRSPRSARRRSRPRRGARRSTSARSAWICRREHRLGLVGVALGLGLADAEDRLRARRRAPPGPCAPAPRRSRRSSWRRSEWPRIDAVDAELDQHRRRDLAGEGALGLLVHVLRGDPDAAPRRSARPRRRATGTAGRGRPRAAGSSGLAAGTRRGTPPSPRPSCASSSWPRRSGRCAHAHRCRASTPGQLACPRAAPARRRRRSRASRPRRRGRTAAAPRRSRRRRPRCGRAPRRPPRRPRACRRRTARSSKAPIGPFQKTVPGRRDRARRRLAAVLRADVEPHPAVGHVDAVELAGARCPRRSCRPSTRSLGSTSSQSEPSACAEHALRQLDALLLDQRVAGRDAPAPEEAEAHRAADQDLVGEARGSARSRRSCRSPWRRRGRRPAAAAGSSRTARQLAHLALQQQAGVAGQCWATPSVRRVGAVGAPKASLT